MKGGHKWFKFATLAKLSEKRQKCLKRLYSNFVKGLIHYMSLPSTLSILPEIITANMQTGLNQLLHGHLQGKFRPQSGRSPLYSLPSQR